MKLRFCENWVKFWSFCHGPKVEDTIRKIHFWPLWEISWALKSIWVPIMILMYLKTYKKGPEDLTRSYYWSHAKILSWKMTIFTPFFWLPKEIWHTRWILSPYKVYIFWKLNVLRTYWVKSRSCSMNIEGVGFLAEYLKWIVTKILKCVLNTSDLGLISHLIQGPPIKNTRSLSAVLRKK